MSTNSVPARVIDQLRANLQAAQIHASEEDIAGIESRGFLARIQAVEQLIAQNSSHVVPDYLKSWHPEPLPVPSHGHSSPEDGGQGEIGRLAADIHARRVSAYELTDQALTAIQHHDPQLNAFQLVLAEHALEAARHADQELAQGMYRGPLHGVPVAIKDLLDLRGTPTTAGSTILAGTSAQHNATAVERLEAAGAIIIGKTRLSEFAYSPGSNNAHYGSTANPHNLAHDTGGSSSGSGAAVAARLVYAALGTDTGGSIRIPAALCGVVGLKPTFGRTSLAGATTLAWSLDHLGPLTRSVADAALLLDILSGYDPRDIRTRQGSQTNCLATLEHGIEGMRIGVLRNDGTSQLLLSDDQRRAWQQSQDVLRQAGATLIEIDMPEIEDLRTVQSAVLPIEAAAFHEPMLREHLDAYGTFMRQRILAAFAFGNRSFVQIQQIRGILRQRCEAIFAQIDILSLPSQPETAPARGTPASIHYTGPFNTLGWPAISMPFGKDAHGLPLAVQLVGPAWGEAMLLRAARALEHHAQV